MSNSEYRPEIDGLRAIAVLAVVLFHAGVPNLGGGYVGVDVFFVISGFLITGILLRDLSAERFSIATFYERRIRRIYPALFAVLAASTVAALVLLLAHELSNFGNSLLATSLFFANYHFMSDTGYFATPAGSKPLLHMWSLAVEEQFYLVLPIGLYAAWRWGRTHLLALAIAATAASLAYALWLMARSPDQAFYSAPARAWELMAGATLAIAMHRGLPPAGLRVSGLMAWVGLLAVLLPMVLYTEATPFPGVAALPPVLGCACLIYATTTPGAPMGRLLAVPPLRFVGLISYSLYLWHWPVLVFFKVWSIKALGFHESALAVALAFALAIATWHWIEKPFRRGGGGDRRRLVLGSGLALMTVGACCGLVLIISHGLPQRMAPEVAKVLAASEDDPARPGCPASDAVSPVFCPIGDATAGPASFVLWGDSHAEALIPAVDAAARTARVAGLYVVRGGCPPLIGVRQLREGFRDCAERAEAFMAELSARPGIRAVIIAARWALYAEGVRFRAEPGHVVFIADGQEQQPSRANNAEVFERSLARTVLRLRDLRRQVVVVTQVPEAEFHIPRALAHSMHMDRPVELAPLKADYGQRQQRVERALTELGRDGRLLTVHPEQILCATARCSVVADGLPLYRDSNHLTATEARRLAPLFVPVLSPLR